MPEIQTQHHTHIPRGVADYFWDEALQRRTLETQLLELFRTWGYGDVIPPMFEYADTYTLGANPRLQSAMYRFLDRDGSTLALRPDMTIPVARLVGTRLHDWPMPQRFCYAGPVFRYAEPQAGRQREFWQAGVELIGSVTPAADAEVITLAVAAVQSAGLTGYRVVVGQIQYFNGLLQDLQLNSIQQAALQQAIDRNSHAELEDFLRNTPLRTQQRRTLEELPRLSGVQPDQIIAHADRLCLNYNMHAALQNLRAICDLLESHGVSEHLFVDLTEIHNLGYYTGVSFELLTPSIGFPIASGGRYDNLIAEFGPTQPAVGLALGIDRLLVARRLQSDTLASVKLVASDLLVDCRQNPTCIQMVNQWRKAGLRVVLTLEESEPLALQQAAMRQGIPSALLWQTGGFRLFTALSAENVTEEFVPVEEAPNLPQRLQLAMSGV
jgi:ATP phosphoribosyltransferase regulatory subunit